MIGDKKYLWQISDIVKILELMGTSNEDITIYEHSEDAWVMAPCPLAPALHRYGKDNNPSFGIHIKNEGITVNHNCFTCGAGNLSDLIHKYNFLIGYNPELNRFFINRRYAEIEETTEVKTDKWAVKTKHRERYNLPVIQKVIDQNPILTETSMGMCAQDVRKWLSSRGISKEIIDRFQIRHNAKSEVVFPLIDIDEIIYDLHARSTTNKFFYHIRDKDKEHKFGSNHGCWFGHQFIEDPTAPVILVESQTDVLRLYTLVSGIYFLGCCGPLTRQHLRRISSHRKIYFGFDSDEAGKKNTIKAINELHSSAQLFLLNWATEGLKDGGDLQNIEQFKRVLKKAQRITYMDGRINVQGNQQSDNKIDKWG